jgi:CMP-N-acetylneuraminic acid synthetase
MHREFSMPPKHERGMVAVILARGGSKGVPRKNVQDLGGRPLISWSVQAAVASRSVDRVIVSTDDEEIGLCARESGAETPFLRPAELAQDHSPTIPVVVHALEWMAAHDGQQFERVVLIQPTSPFVTSNDIDSAHQIAVDKAADAVVSVVESRDHPYWSKRIVNDGRLESFAPRDPEVGRRQELPSAYALNGAIYLVRTDVLLRERTFYTDRTYGYVMPSERSLDIDTPWDLHVARLVINDRLGVEG